MNGTEARDGRDEMAAATDRVLSFRYCIVVVQYWAHTKHAGFIVSALCGRISDSSLGGIVVRRVREGRQDGLTRRTGWRGYGMGRTTERGRFDTQSRLNHRSRRWTHGRRQLYVRPTCRFRLKLNEPRCQNYSSRTCTGIVYLLANKTWQNRPATDRSQCSELSSLPPDCADHWPRDSVCPLHPLTKCSFISSDGHIKNASCGLHSTAPGLNVDV